MNGRLASTMGPVDFTPGISALARVGNEPGAQAGTAGPEQMIEFRALKAGMATASVWGSSATARWRLFCSMASEWAVVLKSETRFLRFVGLVSSAAATWPPLSMKPDRSWGCRPRASWETIELYL